MPVLWRGPPGYKICKDLLDSEKRMDPLDLKPSRAVNSPMIAGIAVLTALAVLGVWIGYRQLHFNPAVSAMRIELPGTVPALQTDSLIFRIPEMLVAATPERYDAANLSDKINGKAELYLAAGFKSLTGRRFSPIQLPDQWVEAFFYEMRDASAAFSVYSMQRREDAAPLNVTRFSYETSNALFMAHGVYYVELIASDVQPPLQEAARNLARAFVASYRVSEKQITETEIFPDAYRTSDEIKLLSAPVFGCECLDRIYTAFYEIQGDRMTAFLARQDSAESARNLALQYREFLMRFGARELELNLDVPEVHVLKIFDVLEAVFTRGPYLAGVHEASNEDRLKILVRTLYQGIPETGNGA